MSTPNDLVLPDAETPQVLAPPQQHKPTAALKPTPQQAAFLDALTSTDRNICLQARAGCLSGDSVIGVNRAGKSYQTRLGNLVHMMNGGTTGNRCFDPCIPTRVRSVRDGVVRLAEVEAATYSGVKETYRLETEGGYILTCTADHRILVPEGWAELRDLRTGYGIVCDFGKSNNGYGPKRVYRRMRGMDHHPYAHSSRPAVCVWTHRLVVEADLNGLEFGEFVRMVRAGEVEHLVFLGPEFHVHHKDNNPINNRLENLEIITASEHKRRHAEEDYYRNVQAHTGIERIASIREWKNEETFDLTMRDEETPCFLADGVAVHNCGKTSAILMGVDAYLSRNPSAEVLVCAFNKSIQTEVSEKLSARGYNWRQVGCQTVHSMGMSLLKYAFRPKVDEHKVWDIIDSLRLHEQRTHPLHVFASTIKSLVGLAKQSGVGFFDESPIPAREVWYTIADHYDVDPFGDVDMDAVVTEAIRVYRTSLDRTDIIDFDDMVLFPLIKGLRVKFQKDLVLGDEVQDWSPIRAAIVKMYCKRGTGRIAIVGDDRQCHPPGTLVEVGKGIHSPIEQLKNGDTIRGWNRNAQKMIGGREIEVSERPYTGRLLRVSIGERDRSTRVTPNHRLLCRWSDRKSEVCVTYLMWRDGFGFRVGWCKLFANGKTAQQVSRSFHLAHRSRIEKADKCWILQVHDTRTGASAYESIIAGRYGLPTITFEPVNGAEHITAGTIAQVFTALKDENTSRGFRCLHDHGREFALPLYPWPTMSEFNDKQGRRTYFEVFASNVLPELMSVPLPDSPNLWTLVTEVTSEIYSGPVYSLDVEEDHSYAADGIVVLNSIYGFSGADHRSMPNLTRELDAITLPLSVTWRCPKAVVELAQRIVPDLEAAPSAPEGQVLSQLHMLARQEAEKLQALHPGYVCLEDLTTSDAILCRNNAPLIPLCYRIIRAGTPARVEGRKIGEGLQELVNRWRVKTTAALRNKILDWRDRETQKLSAKGKEQKAAEIEDRALTLMEIVQECERRGRHDVESVIEFIDRLFGDDVKGAVTLSSYHKSKGREWDRVFLLEHYSRCPSKAARQEWQKIAEQNVAYVAMTRAKKTLVFVG